MCKAKPISRGDFHMNIVMVLDQYHDINNGTTTSARRFMEQLTARGNHVTVLSIGHSDPFSVPVEKLRIPFFQPLIEQQGFCFARPNDEAYYQAFQNADIVHFFLPSPFCRSGEKIARQMKIPTVASFHLQPENVTYSIGLGTNTHANDALYRFFYYHFYTHFRYIHCPSHMIADQLESHGYAAECRVISNGVCDLFYPQPAPRPAEFEGKFVILMIGRLSAEKRQDLLIQAARISRYSGRIQLVFAGQGPLEKKYQKLAKGLPNPAIFRFYPPEDLLKLINVCDLYVHASDAEIEGISCMEAIACGLIPVISNSKLSATKAFSLHPESIFRAGDAASLAEKIDFWIANPKLRVKLSPAYAKSAEQMRVANSAAEMERLYQDAIADCRKNGYRQPDEPRFRRSLHPAPERTIHSYSKRTRLEKIRFAFRTNLLSPVLYCIDTVFLGLHITGKKALKQVKGGAVTVMNHVHPMDCTMVKLALFPRRVYYPSLRRNLELPFTGWLIQELGALSLPTDAVQIAVFQRQLKRGIESGDWIHYYPEGMLVQDHPDLRSFHAGAFFTAVYCGCPIVPLVMTRNRLRGIRRIVGGRRRMHLHVGEPIYPNRTLPVKQAVSELQERTLANMQEMIGRPPEEVISISMAFRAACLIFLAAQVFRLLRIF